MPFQFYCPQGHLLEGHEWQMGQQSQCPMCGSVFVTPLMPGATMPQLGAMPGGPTAPAGWPGYGQPSAPGYGQPAPPGYQPSYQPAPPGYAPTYPGAYAGYPPGYAAGPGSMAPGGMAGYGQPPADQQYAGGQYGGAPAGFQPADPNAFPAVGAEAGIPAIQTEPSPAAQPPEQHAEPPVPPEEKKPAEESKEPRIVRIPCPQGHELQTPMDMVNQDVLCPICGTQFHLRYEDSVEFKQERIELDRRKAEQLNAVALKWSIITAVVVVVGIIAMILYLVLRSAPGDNQHAAPQADAPAGAPAKAPAGAPAEAPAELPAGGGAAESSDAGAAEK